ncbi:glycosyltransferase family 39 protein [Alicyclobacillus fodiniaquatilis]|uniref:Glycosyltransferase family 39 protein n=1 Tax=Alicyclobacillus fodiniaquatilis TaxID=1661150 RepID=A0ABW4JIJ7_9BACL
MMRKWTSLALVPLIVALAVRLFVIFYYGPYVSIHSDDMGYYHSAEWLLQYGIFAYYTPLKPTVHMLPGITFILVAVIAIFGKGALGLYVGKVVFTLIGVTGILGVYKVIEYMWNRWIALCVGLFLAIYIPSIITDTLFLTEPPFMAAFAWTVYFILRAADEQRLKYIVGAAILFVVTIYFRPNVILWAVIALLYLLFKRYPLRLLVGHGAVVIGIVLVCLAPWWIRNALVFHQFIPLTDDSSNPLLLGTFQGINFPAPTNEVTVEHHILDVHPQLRPQSEHEIPWFKAEQHAAMYRIREWYHAHPGDFIQSYFWIKPGVLWNRAYYPIRVLGILPQTMKTIQHWLLWASVIGHAITLLLARGRRRQAIFVVLTLLYYTLLYCVFFAYQRYNEPIMWLMFMGVPTGVYSLMTFGARLFRGRRRSGVAA